MEGGAVAEGGTTAAKGGVMAAEGDAVAAKRRRWRNGGGEEAADPGQQDCSRAWNILE